MPLMALESFVAGRWSPAAESASDGARELYSAVTGNVLVLPATMRSTLKPCLITREPSVV